MALSWQTLLDLLVARAGEDGTLDEIQRTSTEGDLINCFAKNDTYREILVSWISEISDASSWIKLKEKSELLREKGNKKFKEMEYDCCLELYNESICYAPMKSEELSLSYANRSAVLFFLQKFGDAINDIDLAFANGYPQHLHYKLHKRKGECFAKLGKHTEAIAEYNQARLKLVIVNPSYNTCKILKIIQILTNRSTACASQESCESSEVASVCELDIPSMEVNEEFSFASKSLSLREDKEKGRHVIASNDILMGDILFVEKPFASVLLPDHYKSRCHHCYKLFVAPIPCSQCTKAMFCSQDCKKDSWNEYHQWECSGGLNIANHVGIAHLGLRVFLKAGNLAQHQLIDSKRKRKEPQENGHYLSVYSLLTHLESMSAEDRASYALTALCLVLYLVNRTGYFSDHTGPRLHYVPEAEFLLVGGLILRHICQLVCNGHAITAITKKKSQANSDDNVVDEFQTRIGTGIYTSASMMNHSCDPNIINSFYGSSLIVKACKDIRKGEEVVNCYGPHFRRMRSSERKTLLKAQYRFECKCVLCSSDTEFMDKFSAYLCKSCCSPIPEREADRVEMKCPECHSSFVSEDLLRDLRRLRDQHERGCELVLRDCSQEALDVFKLCSSGQKKLLYPSHSEIRSCLDNIAKCYAKLGDYGKAASIISSETLPVIEEQYGSYSIETGYELQKLTDLLIKDLHETKYDQLTYLAKVAETELFILKMKKIFKMHLGIWDPTLQEVLQKESILKTMCSSNSIDIDHSAMKINPRS